MGSTAVLRRLSVHYTQQVRVMSHELRFGVKFPRVSRNRSSSVRTLWARVVSFDLLLDIFRGLSMGLNSHRVLDLLQEKGHTLLAIHLGLLALNL